MLPIEKAPLKNPRKKTIFPEEHATSTGLSPD